MGIFNKRPKNGRIYTLQEALKIVSVNRGVSVIQEGNGYRIVSDEEASRSIAEYISRKRYRDEFRGNIQTMGYSAENIYGDSTNNYIHRYGYDDRDGR